MKSFFALCGGSLLALLAVAVRAEEVKTPHFSMEPPDGWTVVQKNIAETDGKTGNTRMADFSGAEKKGTLYIGVGGRHFSAITMLGETDGLGKTFLREHFKPVDATLFPTAYWQQRGGPSVPTRQCARRSVRAASPDVAAFTRRRA